MHSGADDMPLGSANSASRRTRQAGQPPYDKGRGAQLSQPGLRYDLGIGQQGDRLPLPYAPRPWLGMDQAENLRRGRLGRSPDRVGAGVGQESDEFGHGDFFKPRDRAMIARRKESLVNGNASRSNFASTRVHH